eukprot:gb/GEZN01002526.1/.p1 GENE.gb/GEZN01002526.1/~~gb/GEZN01002526.1/.p1  ORF type:complete len:558 (-),score=73.91 gb/GEZN01002526.1/:67-1740(-)
MPAVNQSPEVLARQLSVSPRSSLSGLCDRKVQVVNSPARERKGRGLHSPSSSRHSSASSSRRSSISSIPAGRSLSSTCLASSAPVSTCSSSPSSSSRQTSSSSVLTSASRISSAARSPPHSVSFAAVPITSPTSTSSSSSSSSSSSPRGPHSSAHSFCFSPLGTPQSPSRHRSPASSTSHTSLLQRQDSLSSSSPSHGGKDCGSSPRSLRRSSSTPSTPALSRQGSLRFNPSRRTSSTQSPQSDDLDGDSLDGPAYRSLVSHRSSSTPPFPVAQSRQQTSSTATPGLSRQGSLKRWSSQGESPAPVAQNDSTVSANSDTLPDHTPSGLAIPDLSITRVRNDRLGSDRSDFGDVPQTTMVTFEDDIVHDPKAFARARAEEAKANQNLNLMVPVALSRFQSDPTSYGENYNDPTGWDEDGMASHGLFDHPNDGSLPPYTLEYVPPPSVGGHGGGGGLPPDSMSSPVSPPIVSPISHDFEPDSSDGLSSDDEAENEPPQPPNYGVFIYGGDPDHPPVTPLDDDDLPFGPPTLVRQNGFYNQATSINNNVFSDDDEGFFDD